MLQGKKPNQPQILGLPSLRPYCAMLWIGSYGCGKFTVSKVIAEYIGFQVFEINWAAVSQCIIANSEIDLILNTVHKSFTQSLTGESKTKSETQDRPAASSMDIYAAKIVIGFKQLLSIALEKSAFVRTKKMIVIRNLEEIFDAIQNRLFVDLLMKHIQTTLLNGGFVDIIPIFVANNEDHFRIRELKTLIKARHQRMSLLYDAYCHSYFKDITIPKMKSIDISIKTLLRNCSYNVKSKISSTMMTNQHKLWSHAVLKFKPPDVSERQLFVQRQFLQISSPLAAIANNDEVPNQVYWTVPKIARDFISVDHLQFPPCRVAVDFANSGDMRQMFIQIELNERNLRSLKVSLGTDGEDQQVDSTAFMYTDEMLDGRSKAIQQPNFTLHTPSSFYKKPITNLFDACHFILRDPALLNHITSYSQFICDYSKTNLSKTGQTALGTEQQLHSTKIGPTPIYIPPNLTLHVESLIRKHQLYHQLKFNAVQHVLLTKPHAANSHLRWRMVMQLFEMSSLVDQAEYIVSRNAWSVWNVDSINNWKTFLLASIVLCQRCVEFGTDTNNFIPTLDAFDQKKSTRLKECEIGLRSTPNHRQVDKLWDSVSPRPQRTGETIIPSYPFENSLPVKKEERYPVVGWVSKNKYQLDSARTRKKSHREPSQLAKPLLAPVLPQFQRHDQYDSVSVSNGIYPKQRFDMDDVHQIAQIRHGKDVDYRFALQIDAMKKGNV
jgi:hypothetical protein